MKPSPERPFLFTAVCVWVQRDRPAISSSPILNCTASAFPASSLSERSGDPDSSGLERSGNPASGAAGLASESKNRQNSLQSREALPQGRTFPASLLERSANPAQRGCRELQSSYSSAKAGQGMRSLLLFKLQAK